MVKVLQYFKPGVVTMQVEIEEENMFRGREAKVMINLIGDLKNVHHTDTKILAYNPNIGGRNLEHSENSLKLTANLIKKSDQSI